ncbi:MAG: hypothetical protein M9892_03200 [Bacteroidetes bacterium]|nr:hypothetical protein [Bacteroidota bacterium]
MAKDILIVESGELRIENGDLCIGDSDVQNLQDLTLLNKGGLKYDPLLGMDLIKLNKKRGASINNLSEINRQLRADGWVNQNVRTEQGEILIAAERTE